MSSAMVRLSEHFTGIEDSYEENRTPGAGMIPPTPSINENSNPLTDSRNTEESIVEDGNETYDESQSQLTSANETGDGDDGVEASDQGGTESEEEEDEEEQESPAQSRAPAAVQTVPTSKKAAAPARGRGRPKASVKIPKQVRASTSPSGTATSSRKQVNGHEEEPKSSNKSKHGKSSKTKKIPMTYALYIHKVFKDLHPDYTMSSRTMCIIDSFVIDMFERLAKEAAVLTAMNKRNTLTSRELATATRLVLPGSLATHAIAEGSKALQRYEANRDREESNKRKQVVEGAHDQQSPPEPVAAPKKKNKKTNSKK